jgi:hypothetical protein
MNKQPLFRSAEAQAASVPGLLPSPETLTGEDYSALNTLGDPTASPIIVLGSASLDFTFSMSTNKFIGASRKNVICKTGAARAFVVTTTTAGARPSWLSIMANSPGTPLTLTIAVDAAGVSPGTFPVNISVAAQGANTLTLPVTLTVNQSEPASPNAVPDFTIVEHAARDRPYGSAHLLP